MATENKDTYQHLLNMRRKVILAKNGESVEGLSKVNINPERER